MKKILATIVIILLIVALGCSVFFAATHSNQSDSQIKHNLLKRKIKKKLLLKVIQFNLMKQVSLTMVPLRNLSQQVNQYKNTNKRHNVTLLFRLHSQKQVNHQLRHNHNIVQKVTHQNNPHLKAQKTNYLQSKHQLNNLQQKKNLHRNKVRSLQLKVTLIVVVNLITNLIKK